MALEEEPEIEELEAQPLKVQQSVFVNVLSGWCKNKKNILFATYCCKKNLWNAVFESDHSFSLTHKQTVKKNFRAIIKGFLIGSPHPSEESSIEHS